MGLNFPNHEVDSPVSSVQFSRSVVSDFLRPHGLQHTRPPCPSPTPGVHPDSPYLELIPDPLAELTTLSFVAQGLTAVTLLSSDPLLMLRRWRCSASLGGEDKQHTACRLLLAVPGTLPYNGTGIVVILCLLGGR